MDLNLFNDDTSAASAVVPQTDGDKFQKISNILAVKRKSLEDTLESKGVSATDEERLALRDLIEEMRTFGISEIDYQKFLAMEAKKDN